MFQFFCCRTLGVTPHWHQPAYSTSWQFIFG
jgi:hypothetical protein